MAALQNIVAKITKHMRQINHKTYSSTSYLNFVRQKIVKNILQNTIESRNHLTPEINLRLITPECKIFHEPFLNSSEKLFENDPFWGFYWPGGQAISRYILDNKHLFESKTILDVGSGSGACSIAAAKCNAKYVIANDIDTVAGIAAEINANLNDVNNKIFATSTENLIGLPCNEDIILLGDLFYDSEFALNLIPWLENLYENGKIIIIGDPGRHGLTKNHLKYMKKLANYELTENCCIENNGFKFVNVWKFSK